MVTKTSDRIGVYVMDSYALIALYLNESGAGHVRSLLNQRRSQHWMTHVNLGEVFYKLVRERGEQTANEVLEDVTELPIRFVDADRSLCLEAAAIKGRFPLSYADCFAAALSQRVDGKIVTGDLEFTRLEDIGLVNVEWLTPKPKTRRAR